MDRPGVRIILALLLIGAGISFLVDSLELAEIGALLWAAIFVMAGGLAFLQGGIAMDRPGVRIVLALLLIGAGVLFLVDSLELVEIGALLWAAVLVMGGLAFLSVFVLDREQWWALIPGFVLLSLGFIVGAAELLPGLEGGWLGALFLGCVGLAFWAIFLVRRDAWWAIIPGGALWTVALVAGLSETLRDEYIGGILFLGLGLTFAALSLVQTPQGRMKWALIPCAVMLIMALIVFAAAGGRLFAYLWPAALILAGLYLLLRFALSRR